MTEVVVDNGKAFVSEESATIATEAASRAKQWAEESERQANIATTNADTAVDAKDDAIAAKNLAQDWAVKMDGMVNNEDYSSKYYASQSASSASSAQTHKNNAQIWAEGTDAQVQGLGGEHSAKGWSQQESSNYSVTATGTTIPRTLKDRFADIINIKDFGAVGDGVTDDTDIFQYVINYCIANNKTLFIPAGNYKITDISTTTTYTSEDAKCLKIFGTSGTKLSVSGSITIGNTVTQYIQDLYINGSSTTKPTLVIGGPDMVFNGYYKGVKIFGNPTAVYFRRAFDIGFEDCRFASYSHYTEPVEVRPTMIFGKGSSDWNIDQSPNCITFTRCQWEGTDGNGAQVYFSDENDCRSYVVSFFGCHFESRNRNSRAFYIKSAQTVGFYNCTFTNNDNYSTTDTHTRVPNYVENTQGLNIVNCNFDRYDNKMIEFVGNKVRFFNILATTQNSYTYTNYLDLSTFFTIPNTINTNSWKCRIHNGISSNEIYEYNVISGKTGKKYKDLVIGGNGTPYTMESDGYLNFEMTSGAAGEKIKIINQLTGQTRQISVSSFASGANQKLCVVMPASKGDQLVIIYDTTGTSGQLRFVNSEGAI